MIVPKKNLKIISKIHSKINNKISKILQTKNKMFNLKKK